LFKVAVELPDLLEFSYSFLTPGCFNDSKVVDGYPSSITSIAVSQLLWWKLCGLNVSPINLVSIFYISVVAMIIDIVLYLALAAIWGSTFLGKRRRKIFYTR
jgi:hypothetical protein